MLVETVSNVRCQVFYSISKEVLVPAKTGMAICGILHKWQDPRVSHSRVILAFSCF